jgi:hypothetical protein
VPQQKGKRKTIDDHISDYEKVAGEHGGVAPLDVWFTRHNRSGLLWIKKRNPERFAHVEQTSERGKKREHLADYERLASEHGGAAPHDNRLVALGYHGLVRTKRRHPEQFAHIPQIAVKHGGCQLVGFRGGTKTQRKALYKKAGIPYTEL